MLCTVTKYVIDFTLHIRVEGGTALCLECNNKTKVLYSVTPLKCQYVTIMITFKIRLNDFHCAMGNYIILYSKHSILYYRLNNVYQKFISCANILSKSYFCNRCIHTFKDSPSSHAITK